MAASPSLTPSSFSDCCVGQQEALLSKCVLAIPLAVSPATAHHGDTFQSDGVERAAHCQSALRTYLTQCLSVQHNLIAKLTKHELQVAYFE